MKTEHLPNGTRVELARRNRVTDTSKLANEFCRILNEWLTREQLIEANHLNALAASAGDRSVCHSHDHCDANQAMLDAWEIVFGKGSVPAIIREGSTDEEINADDRIWNEAWRIAKERGFKCVAN